MATWRRLHPVTRHPSVESIQSVEIARGESASSRHSRNDKERHSTSFVGREVSEKGSIVGRTQKNGEEEAGRLHMDKRERVLSSSGLERRSKNSARYFRQLEDSSDALWGGKTRNILGSEPHFVHCRRDKVVARRWKITGWPLVPRGG